MDIREIWQGWYNVAFTKKLIEEIAKERMEICKGCPDMTNILSIKVCGLCSCPLKAKTRTPNNSCPAKKWKR